MIGTDYEAGRANAAEHATEAERAAVVAKGEALHEKSALALGIIAVVLAAIGFFVPGIGPFIVFVALILASIAAFLGEKPLTIATLVVGIVNLFLSPTLLANPFLLIPYIILLPLTIIGLIVGRKKGLA